MLEIEPNNDKAIRESILIARKEGNIRREKELIQKKLQINAKDVRALSSLSLIVRKEGNTEEEKRILEKILEIEPQNVKAFSRLSLIARNEGDIKREKELLQQILQVDPTNLKAMSSLIRIARSQGDIEEESKLLNMQLQVDPNNRVAIKGLEIIGEGINENIFTSEIEGNTNPIQIARNLIVNSNSKDMLKVINQIKELIENEDPTLKVLVQSEAATKAKLFKQAEGYLKRYKREIKENEVALKAISRALVIVQLKNKLYDPLKWKEIYNEYRKSRVVQNNGDIQGDNTIITNSGETQGDEEGR